LYELTPPPPKDEWVDVNAVEEEDEEAKVRRFLDAKRAAIKVYGALQQGDWDTALENMSQETRSFLEDASGGEGAAVTLERRELLVSGQQVPFDPIADFFISDLADIRDEVPGQEEAETPRRKELYAVSREGEARKVLFIYEADRWVFHSPFVRTPTFM